MKRCTWKHWRRIGNAIHGEQCVLDEAHDGQHQDKDGRWLEPQPAPDGVRGEK